MEFFDNILFILETLSNGMSAFFSSFTLTFSEVFNSFVGSFPWVEDVLGDLLRNSWIGEQSFLLLTLGVGVIAVVFIKVIKGIFL